MPSSSAARSYVQLNFTETEANAVKQIFQLKGKKRNIMSKAVKQQMYTEINHCRRAAFVLQLSGHAAQ